MEVAGFEERGKEGTWWARTTVWVRFVVDVFPIRTTARRRASSQLGSTKLRAFLCWHTPPKSRGLHPVHVLVLACQRLGTCPDSTIPNAIPRAIAIAIAFTFAIAMGGGPGRASGMAHHFLAFSVSFLV
ncbi:uncharacterized protein ColSpa_07506 [Colletotrichum spaethianum]|uniref:Uncharacterized protein n=1 Tax=Colletotrichum spaethianum TaxID=700344 RepID=A0AA37LIR5_9PEZI|nr:uncharacterized protein ColSpa_07506 [Colletotrichum spaethianum]GKT47325.1 hypothetical protein ColSpa_07506 [Colletotrichum spaethianum]